MWAFLIVLVICGTVIKCIEIKKDINHDNVFWGHDSKEDKKKDNNINTLNK